MNRNQVLCFLYLDRRGLATDFQFKPGIFTIFAFPLDIFGFLVYTVIRNSIHTPHRFGRWVRGLNIGRGRNVLFFFLHSYPSAFQGKCFFLFRNNGNRRNISIDFLLEYKRDRPALINFRFYRIRFHNRPQYRIKIICCNCNLTALPL